MVGILVYAPYKKSAIHKLSTVHAMLIIADAMKQDQVLKRKLTEYIIQVIKYQSAVFK